MFPRQPLSLEHLQRRLAAWALVAQALSWLALKVGILAVALYYIAGFSAPQTFAIVVLAVYWSTTITVLRARNAVEPFWVHVKPHLRELLIDHGAIDELGWKKLCNLCEQRVKAVHQLTTDASLQQLILKRVDREYPLTHGQGFSVTVLPDNVIYHDERGFMRRLALFESLDPDESTHLWKFPPQVYILAEPDGWKLGVVRLEPGKQWPEARIQRLVVATIPAALFAPFAGIKANETVLQRELQKNGWTEEPPDRNLALGMEPNTVVHRYFTVTYDYLWPHPLRSFH